MDPSALIFVALAVAWAAYLIPKALEHHEESVRTRTVQTFSHTMRVLARREPAGRRATALVPVTADAAAPATATAEVEPAPVTPLHPAARRRAAAVAARRRRNVLGLLLIALATVAGLAQFQVIAWAWTAAPGGLIVAWLVACRLMVKRERRAPAARRRPAPVAPVAPAPVDDEHDPITEEIAAVAEPAEPEVYAAAAEPTDPTGHGWAPVDVPLPTYVSKPAAPRRSVRTIDLDSTGVWTSGRTAADSALAREADEAARAAKATPAEQRRATGA